MQIFKHLLQLKKKTLKSSFRTEFEIENLFLKTVKYFYLMVVYKTAIDI